MELPIFNTYINFYRHHFCCFTIAPLFVLDKSTAWNRCLHLPCFKNLCKIAQASKKSSGSSLPLIFCIHVRSEPIYWGGLFTLQKKL
jgi:uncharacterized protein YbcC (UPF0753/DUF2309 family)